MTQQAKGNITFEMAGACPDANERLMVELFRLLRTTPGDAPVLVVTLDEDEQMVKVALYGDWTDNCPRDRVLAGVVSRLVNRSRRGVWSRG